MRHGAIGWGVGVYGFAAWVSLSVSGSAQSVTGGAAGGGVADASWEAEREFYELLMRLDEFERFATSPLLPGEASLREPVSAEADGESVGADGTDDAVPDEAWVLSLMTLLDEERAAEAWRALAELDGLARLMAVASEASTGRVREAIDASLAEIDGLIEAGSRRQRIDPDAARMAIGEAQRVLAVYHCRRANREASGSLANPDPPNRDRIEDLAIAARLMLASSQTASYRIPPEAKRSLASAVAMSRLFDEQDVRVGQVRARAREIERALEVLGEAIRRGRR